MSAYDVEKDVPPPARYRRLKYPWDEMEVGDSVVIPWEDGRPKRYLQSNVSQTAKNWLAKHRPDMVSTTRSEEKGVRVWFIDSAVPTKTLEPSE